VKEVEHTFDNTPFMLYMLLKSGLTRENVDKFDALLMGRLNLINVSSWRIIFPYLLGQVSHPAALPQT
jgi:hypothetical protein